MIITYIYNYITYNKVTTIHPFLITINFKEERKQNHYFYIPFGNYIYISKLSGLFDKKNVIVLLTYIKLDCVNFFFLCVNFRFKSIEREIVKVRIYLLLSRRCLRSSNYVTGDYRTVHVTIYYYSFFLYRIQSRVFFSL